MRNVIKGVALDIGGLLMLLGFVVFQWVSVLGFGRTGLQIVLENQQSLPAQLRLVGEQPLWTLWLVLLTAVAALFVGWRILLAGAGQRSLLTVLLFALAVATLYPFWVTYTGWTTDLVQTTDLLASGFWLALAGNVLVGVTALVASR